MDVSENFTFENGSNSSDHFYYYSLDFILYKFGGSTWTLDCINLYLYFFTGLIGFIINAFSFLILQDFEFNLPLYQYFRIYTIINSIMCLSTALSFISCTYRILPWTNSEITLTLGVNYMIQLDNVLYFYGSLIDLLILFDRISSFKPNLKLPIKLSPYKMSFVCFIGVLLISCPLFFVNQIDSRTFKLNQTVNFTVWNFHNSDFAKSPLGTGLTYFVYAIRDVLVMILQIVLNLISIGLFKKYVMKKMTMATRVPVIDDQISYSVSIVKHSTSRRLNFIHRADQKLTQMCILICVLSIFEHVLVLATTIYPYTNSDFLMLVILLNVSFFFWQLKRIVDFFMFFAFNKIFKRVCLRYLRFRWH
jgi:hypothetical protein